MPKFYAICIDLPVAGAPQNVTMRCFANTEMNMTYGIITWHPPEDARGTIVGYKVS